MKLDLFLNKTENIKAENKILKFFVVLIGVLVLINTSVVYKSVKHQRTILVPVGLNSKVEITDNTASDEYVRHIARYLFGLAFNYTPHTARQQFDELLTFYSPATFPEAKSRFYNLADTIEVVKVSQVFYISKMERQGNKVYVTGSLRQYAEDKKIIDDKTKRYVMDFEINEGKFNVIDIKEIEGQEEKPL